MTRIFLVFLAQDAGDTWRLKQSNLTCMRVAAENVFFPLANCDKLGGVGACTGEGVLVEGRGNRREGFTRRMPVVTRIVPGSGRLDCIMARHVAARESPMRPV